MTETRPAKPRFAPIRVPVVCRTEVDCVRDEIIYALSKHENVFHRGGRLVHVVRPTKHDDGEHLLDEPPEIRRMNSATLVPAATAVIEFQKAKKNRKGEIEYIATLPNGATIGAVLEAGEYPYIPQLLGVSETPILCPDGEIVREEGYDRETGVYYAPNAEYIRFTNRPTQKDAREAYARLVTPFTEFPFDPPGLGRSVVVAAILSILGRNAIRGPTPLFLVQKNIRGCGGTLLSDAIAIIATGRNAGRMTMPEEHEELEKVLGAFALRGAQLITFDNVHRLGGGPLDKCITAMDTVDLRLLGQSKIETLPWRAVILVNGNNVEIAGDTTRRVLCVTLTSNLEQPEKRTGFEHPDLRAYLLGHRVELVHEALTILSAYLLAKKPDMGAGTLGSFEEWSKLVAHAIVFAGGENPIGAYAEAVGVVDAERQALETLIIEWERLDVTGDGLTVKAALTALYPQWREREREPAAPDGFDDLREAIEVLVPPMPGKPPNAKALGKLIAKTRKRVIGGRMFDGKSAKAGVVKWRTVKVQGGLGDLGGFTSPPRARNQQEESYKTNGVNHPTQTSQPTLAEFEQDMADLGIEGAE